MHEISNAVEALNDLLADTGNDSLIPSESTTPSAWRVDSVAKALWIVRRLSQLHQQKADYRNAAHAEIARIKEWADTAERTLTEDIEHLESLLAPWVKEQLAGGKRKSLRLLSATVGYRTPPKQLAYDEPTLLAWAKTERRTWIRVKEELDKSAIRQSVLTDHEVVRDADGRLLVDTLQPPETFYVKLATEETEA